MTTPRSDRLNVPLNPDAVNREKPVSSTRSAPTFADGVFDELLGLNLPRGASPSRRPTVGDQVHALEQEAQELEDEGDRAGAFDLRVQAQTLRIRLQRLGG